MWLIDPCGYSSWKASLDTLTADSDAFISAMAVGGSDAGVSRVLTVQDGTATIDVRGVLAPTLDMQTLLTGGTSYADIRAGLLSAERDASVRRIVMRINSPGGRVDGLFETLDLMSTLKKPITSLSGLALSAGYALASATTRIVAASEAAEFGSIGVATQYRTDDSVVTVSSTGAPNKAPDPRTEDGKASIRERLDGLHDLFVSAVAKGRYVSQADVAARFGQGGVVLAAAAKQAGMIDSLPTVAARVRASTSARMDGDSPTEMSGDEQMDINELRAKYPSLCADISGEATVMERKRSAAHVTMAESSGAADVALKAIASGARVGDDDIQAAYLSAAINKSAQGARQADAGAASAVLDGSAAVPEPVARDSGDMVADAMFGPEVH